MTDQDQKVIASEMLLAVSQIATRYGIEHDPARMFIYIHGANANQMQGWETWEPKDAIGCDPFLSLKIRPATTILPSVTFFAPYIGEQHETAV